MLIVQAAVSQPSTVVPLRLKWYRRFPFLIKLFHWEYWPFAAVYTPIYFYWFYLCAKARSVCFFSAANPSIAYGGFLMERKSDIYPLIPPAFYPKTVLLHPQTALQKGAALIESAGLEFPLIVKPDIGGKGKGVRKVQNMSELLDYVAAAPLPMLVQACIAYTNEVGIFYYRYPWQERGRISGMVAKTFLSVTGDGHSSLLQLLQQEKRYILQLPALQKMPGLDLAVIPAAGEKSVLAPFGNHARGARFTDVSHWITPALETAIDNICCQIPGFYYGRLDMMFDRMDLLEKGQAFSIIELNGAGSEPAHIYDPGHSIWFAWKEIIRHWKILHRIGTWMHRHHNIPYLSLRDGIRMFKQNKQVQRQLDKLL